MFSLSLLCSGNVLPTPIISSHTRDRFTFDQVPPPPPPDDVEDIIHADNSLECSGVFNGSNFLDVSNESTFYDQDYSGTDVRRDMTFAGGFLSSVNSSRNDRDVEPLSKTLTGINSPLVSLMNSSPMGGVTNVQSVDIPPMMLPPSL